MDEVALSPAKDSTKDAVTSIVEEVIEAASKEPEVAVTIIGFHHTKGNVVEACYPTCASLEASDELAFSALPDGAHHSTDEDDWCYVRVKTAEKYWYGVSCVRQVQRDADDLGHRGHVQKALCMLSSRPAYGALVGEVRIEAQNLHSDMSLETAFQAADKAVAKNLEDVSALGCDAILEQLGGLAAWRLVKALMLERSVIVVGPEKSTKAASEGALGIAALVPNFIDAALTESRTSVSETMIPEQLRPSDAGVWYVGQLLGERAVLEPSASIAHLTGLLTAVNRPGDLVVCGCANPNIARTHLAPAFSKKRPAALVTIPSNSPEPPTPQQTPDEETKPDGIGGVLARTGGFLMQQTQSAQETLQQFRGPDAAGPLALLQPTSSPPKVAFHASSSSSKSLGGGHESPQDAKKSPKTPPPPSKMDAPPPPPPPPEASGAPNTDPLGASWRPTKCERELLEAVDEARLEIPEESRDEWCRRAVSNLVAQMIADVGTTDPRDSDAVQDLIDRWDGAFLYAWLTGTRNGSAWADVYATEWAKLIPRRKELADLLRPSVVQKLVQSTSVAAEHLKGHAERLSQETQLRTQNARNWLSSAATRSYQASLDAIDQAREAAASASDNNNKKSNFASFYSSVGDVVSGATTFATRKFENIRTAQQQFQQQQQPSSADVKDDKSDDVHVEQPTHDVQKEEILEQPRAAGATSEALEVEEEEQQQPQHDDDDSPPQEPQEQEPTSVEDHSEAVTTSI